MANLLGQNIGTNYKGILNLDSTINTPLDATLRAVTDGEGNASGLKLSTTDSSFSGKLGVGADAPTFNIESKSVGNQLKITNPNDIYTYLEVNANGGQFNMKFGNGSGTTHFINNYSTGVWASNKWAFGSSYFAPSAQVHIKGSGTTSATLALLVQNSSGSTAFQIKDDREVSTSGGNVSLRDGALFIGSGFITTYGQSIGFFGAAVASAIVEMRSTTKGFLPPRMTTTQKNAISSPAAGLVVYDETTNKLACYNGTTWNDLF